MVDIASVNARSFMLGASSSVELIISANDHLSQ